MPTLFDIVSSEKFRDIVYSSYGRDFGFWIYEDGNYSCIVDFKVLEPELCKMQQNTPNSFEKEIIANPDKAPVVYQQLTKAVMPYASAKLELLASVSVGKKIPKAVVNVCYDPYDMDTIATCAKKGWREFPELCAGKALPYLTDALALSCLPREITYLNVLHHDRKPGSSSLGIFKQEIILVDPVRLAFAYHLYTIKMLLGAKISAKMPKLYTSAVLLLNPEGIVESPEEARKALSVFDKE
jgi:hypothetical protein